ncbi:hypothetical protein RSA42_04835 [Exiguobacterium indicum]|nr:hypothetical protein RSA42_04835 [Exiguobacterium indicum]
MLPFPVGVEDARFVLNEQTSKAIDFRQWNRSLLVLNTFTLLTCLHPTPTGKSATFHLALSETNKTRIRHPRDEEDWLVSRLRKAGEKTVRLATL